MKVMTQNPAVLLMLCAHGRKNKHSITVSVLIHMMYTNSIKIMYWMQARPEGITAMSGSSCYHFEPTNKWEEYQVGLSISLIVLIIQQQETQCPLIQYTMKMYGFVRMCTATNENLWSSLGGRCSSLSMWSVTIVVNLLITAIPNTDSCEPGISYLVIRNLMLEGDEYLPPGGLFH